jgi:hypothetical protein
VRYAAISRFAVRVGRDEFAGSSLASCDASRQWALHREIGAVRTSPYAALVAYYNSRKREGWDVKRLAPLLAGLDQPLPWIHQWHPEIDKDFSETAGQSFQTMLEHDAHELGLTMEEIRAWTPPVPISCI